MDEERPTPEPEPAIEDATEAVAPADDAAPTGSRSRLRIAVVLTLVAAVVLLAALQLSGVVKLLGGSSNATAPTRIAVVDAAGTLTTMDDRGGSLVPHPVDGVQFVFPAWSPDGTRIAAIGGATSDGGVYVFQARGEGNADPTAVTAPLALYRSPDRPPFYVYWTPDSRQVTFLTTEPEGLAMRVAPADASAAAAVVREGSPLYWDWIEPARVLMNVGAGGPDAFLGEVGLDGAAGTPAASAPGIFRSPVVSHDGTHRAFVIATGGSESIVIESRDGADRHEIPIPGMAAIGFAPAGTSLAFIAPETSGPAIGLPIGPLRIVDVASGSARKVLDGADRRVLLVAGRSDDCDASPSGAGRRRARFDRHRRVRLSPSGRRPLTPVTPCGSYSSMSRAERSARHGMFACRICSGCSSCRSSTSTRSVIGSGRRTARRFSCRWCATTGSSASSCCPPTAPRSVGSPMARWDPSVRDVASIYRSRLQGGASDARSVPDVRECARPRTSSAPSAGTRKSLA